MYEIVLLRRAKKALGLVGASTRERIPDRLDDLKGGPCAEKRPVSQKVRRAHVGNHGILFHVCAPERKVVVPCITKRGRAYKR